MSHNMMVTLNSIPFEQELPLGAVVINRITNKEAVVLGKDIKLKKDIFFYLFGWLLGIKPEKVTIYWLMSLNAYDQYSVEDFNLKQQFAFRGRILARNELLAKMIEHETFLILLPNLGKHLPNWGNVCPIIFF